MRNLLVIISIVFLNPATAQSLTILDSSTKEPVPFATVLLVDDNEPLEGYYADEEGKIRITPSLKYDRLEFSCVGFADRVIEKDSVTDGPVYLDKITYKLKEVFITGKPKHVDKGFIKGTGTNWVGAKLGAQVVLFIDNSSGEERKVASFIFKARTPKGFKTAFRIHFYRTDPVTGWPGEETPHRDIVKYIPPGKAMKEIEVDVSEYEIMLSPDGLYAGIEWLSSTDDTGKILGDEDYQGWYSTSVEYNSKWDVPLSYCKRTITDTEWLQVNGGNASFRVKLTKE